MTRRQAIQNAKLVLVTVYAAHKPVDVAISKREASRLISEDFVDSDQRRRWNLWGTDDGEVIYFESNYGHDSPAVWFA